MRRIFNISCIVYVLAILLLPTSSHAFFGFFAKEPVHIALVQAADLGNTNYVNQLLQQGHAVNALDGEGMSALSRAAYRGHSEIVRSLVRYGADVNILNKAGETPLHLAAQNGHPQVVKTLVKNGASLDIISAKGYTALDYALATRNVDVIAAIDPLAVTVVTTEAAFPAVAAAAAAGGGGLSTGAILTTAGVAAAGGGVALAAGGGGGGGGGGSSSSSSDSGSGSNNNSSSNSGSSGSSSPSAAQQEYEYQRGLDQVNADFAYDRGYTGSGVTVAVVDTGVFTTFSDIDSNIVSGFDTGDNDADPTPNSTSSADLHGSVVAGIIATEKDNSGYHGIAYNAKIMPVKVQDSNAVVSTDGQGNPIILSTGAITYGYVNSGINYAVNNGAHVINISLGGSVADANMETALTNGINNGVIIVAATGNNGASNPVYPARYAATLNTGVPDSDLNDPNTGVLIAVGSVNSSNSISSFSNDCGVAANWCMVAPGEGIRITGNLVGTVSGTSFAAPHVAGAAAVLKHAASSRGQNLSGRTIGEILLVTATDLGAAGIDTVYGHGLLNLQAALAPIGVTSVPLSGTVGGSSAGLDSSIVIASAPFGDALNGAGMSLTVLDSYERAYTVDLDSITSLQSATMELDERMEYFGQPLFDQHTQLDENVSFGFSHVVTKNPESPEEEATESARMSLAATVDERADVSLFFNSNIAHGFGVSALDNTTPTLSEHALVNPYLALVEEGNSFAFGYQFADKSQLKFASFQGSQEENSQLISGFVSELSSPIGNGVVSFQSGLLNEKSTLLGSSFDGAFALQGDTPTWFYTVAGEYALSEKLQLFGMATQGVSFPEGGSESLFGDFSTLHSNAFSAGIKHNGTWKDSDSIGLMVSQPLRITGGDASLTLPTARDVDGNIYSQRYAIDLAPSGREIDTQLFYSRPVGDQSSIKSALMYRHQPGHIKDAEGEGVMMMRFNQRF